MCGYNAEGKSGDARKNDDVLRRLSRFTPGEGTKVGIIAVEQALATQILAMIPVAMFHHQVGRQRRGVAKSATQGRPIGD